MGGGPEITPDASSVGGLFWNPSQQKAVCRPSGSTGAQQHQQSEKLKFQETERFSGTHFGLLQGCEWRRVVDAGRLVLLKGM